MLRQAKPRLLYTLGVSYVLVLGGPSVCRNCIYCCCTWYVSGTAVSYKVFLLYFCLKQAEKVPTIPTGATAQQQQEY